MRKRGPDPESESGLPSAPQPLLYGRYVEGGTLIELCSHRATDKEIKPGTVKTQRLRILISAPRC